MSLSRILTSCTTLFVFLFFCSITQAREELAPWVGETLTGELCKGGPQGYGPYDYTQRSYLETELFLVESAHFQSGVEMLKEGTSAKGATYADLNYTLRAFPNHHRALNTLIRFLSTNVDYRITSLSPPECYFIRALHFSPKDATTHMLYAIFLHKLNKYELALQEYKKSEEYNPSNIQLEYNIGLLYFDMKDYEKSKMYALKAYAKNFPFQGLKNKLKEVGFW